MQPDLRLRAAGRRSSTVALGLLIPPRQCLAIWTCIVWDTGHPAPVEGPRQGDRRGTEARPSMTSVDRFLLIHADPAAAKVVREALADSTDGTFEVEWVTRLSDGLERVSRSGIKAVLLNV